MRINQKILITKVEDKITKNDKNVRIVNLTDIETGDTLQCLCSVKDVIATYQPYLGGFSLKQKGYNLGLYLNTLEEIEL